MSILLPLWSGYLVKVYAWRLILSQGGVLNWVAGAVRAERAGLQRRRGLAGRDLSLAAVHDHPDLRRPRADPDLAPRGLGGPRRARAGSRSGGSSCRSSCRPSSRARSSRSSLTLGDYITPTLVSNTQFIGNVVYDFVGVAGNQPLAAAFAMVPVTIMLVYLLIARRLGAFEAL